MKELALDTVQLDLFLKNLNVNFFFFLIPKVTHVILDYLE